MHPEVRSETPGRCPKCGMELVPEGSATVHAESNGDAQGLGTLTWKNYIPLIVIFSILLLATKILSWKDIQTGNFSIYRSVEYFMTGFFMVFAGFKFFDLKGFAEGYSTYDLLAQRWFAYGYLYPFLELGFGFAMLSGYASRGLWLAEVLVMGFSGVGVLIKVLRKEKFRCVCLGTVLKVPLTSVTLIEDFGMAALALVLLLHGK